MVFKNQHNHLQWYFLFIMDVSVNGKYERALGWANLRYFRLYHGLIIAA